jgi:hypothetical protein
VPNCDTCLNIILKNQNLTHGNRSRLKYKHQPFNVLQRKKMTDYCENCEKYTSSHSGQITELYKASDHWVIIENVKE